MRRIAILGDFNPAYATHHALNESIRHVEAYLKMPVHADWISTTMFDSAVVFRQGLYAGLWIAPGSPYKDFENVLRVITYARLHHIPTLGNCGGFQHMVIEFARNVCGIAQADHEETNADAEDLVIHRLACSLAGLEENLMIAESDSLMHSIIKKQSFTGRYFCSYGLNEKYQKLLSDHGLTFTTKSDDGFMRALELKSHPFFIGTLFQPALTSTAENPDPVIVSFVRKCL